MKVLAVIVQSKKGENLFLVTSNLISQELVLHYSRIIYELIIKQFKTGKKIERSFLIDNQITCISNISKEVIIEVLTGDNNIFTGYDTLKKTNDFIMKSIKVENLQRKYLEVFCTLEDMIYTKEISQSKPNLPALRTAGPETKSNKKIADCEVFDKFNHIINDREKNMIANIPLKYARKGAEKERENKILDFFGKTFKENINPSDANPKRNVCLRRKAQNEKFALKFKMRLRKQEPSVPAKQPNNFASVNGAKAANYMGLGSENIDEVIKKKELQATPPNAQAQGALKEKLAERPKRPAQDINLLMFSPEREEKYEENIIDVQESPDLSKRVPNRFDDLLSAMPGTSKPSSQPQNPSHSSNNLNDLLQMIDFSLDVSSIAKAPAEPAQKPKTNTRKEFDLLSLYEQSAPLDLNNSGNPAGNAALNVAGSNSGSSATSKSFAPSFPLTEIGLNQGTADFLRVADNSEINKEKNASSANNGLAESKIELRIMEKLMLTILNGKIQELKIMGQLMMDGVSNRESELTELSNVWADTEAVIKKFKEGPIPVVSAEGNKLRVKTNYMNLSPGHPIFDYIVSPKKFSLNKIPLIVVYQVKPSDQNPKDLEVLLQYKVHDAIEESLVDIEVEMHLKTDLFFEDVKTTPAAYAFRNKVAIWRAKVIQPQSKGKLYLWLKNCDCAPKQLIQFIKLSLKTQSIIMDDMDACVPGQNLNYFEVSHKRAKRKSFVEYKILPNTN